MPEPLKRWSRQQGKAQVCLYDLQIDIGDRSVALALLYHWSPHVSRVTGISWKQLVQALPGVRNPAALLFKDGE